MAERVQRREGVAWVVSLQGGYMCRDQKLADLYGMNANNRYPEGRRPTEGLCTGLIFSLQRTEKPPHVNE